MLTNGGFNDGYKKKTALKRRISISLGGERGIRIVKYLSGCVSQSHFAGGSGFELAINGLKALLLFSEILGKGRG
jgi:hypothetical protein